MIDAISHPIDFLDIGDAVTALQAALKTEGFRISEDEARLGIFGRSSREALTGLQERLGLDPIGRVDEATARVLNAHLDRQGLLRESRAILRDIGSLRRVADAGDLPPEADRILARIADAELNRLVLSQFPRASEELRDAVDGLGLTFAEHRNRPLDSVLRETVLPRLAERPGLDAEVYRAAAKTRDLTSESVASRLGLSGDLRRMPGLETMMRRTRVDALGALAELTEDERSALEAVDLSTVGRIGLTRAAEAAGVSAERIEMLAELADAARLVDDDFEAVAALRDEGFTRARDLVALDASGWEQFLSRRNLPPPDGMEIADFARVIDLNVQSTFPTAYALRRFAAPPDRELLDRIEALERVPSDGSGRLSGTPNVSALRPAERRAAQAAIEALRPFANRYARLGIAAILDDPDDDAPGRRRRIVDRLAALRRFHEANPDYDLRHANLREEEGRIAAAFRPDFTTVPEDDRPHVRRFLSAVQRVYAMAGAIDEADVLLRAGYDTAARLRATPRERLIADLALPEAAIDRIRARAASIAIHRDHMIANLGEIDLSPFTFAGEFEIEDPVVPAALNALRELDGFAEMFGNQNFCACDHCRSVYGPAAYLVDLMRFIDREVTEPVFRTPGRLDHPLALRRRRPDLWSLELSCENTDTRIPYLVITNEVLARVLSETFGEDDTDHAMAELQGSFLQPFNLAFAEIGLYLARLGLGPGDLAAPLELPEATRVRLLLGLAPEANETILIPAPETAPGRYGFVGPLNGFPVPDVLRRAGLERDMLDRLVALPVIRGGLQLAVETTSVDGDIFGFTETLEIDFSEGPSAPQQPHLARQMLDRLHRLIRLARRLDWPPEALDFLVLQALADDGVNLPEDDPQAQAATLGPALGPDLVRRIAGIRSLSRRLKLELPEALALVAPPPPALEPGGADLAARLTGGVAVLDIRHPDLGNSGGGEATEGTGLSILRSATRLGDRDLLLLIEAVLEEAEISSGEIGLEAAVRLYRPARLARALRLPVAELLQLADLGSIDLAAAGIDARLTAASDLADLAEEIAAGRLSIGEHAWALDPAAPRPQGLGPNPTEPAAAARARLAAARLAGFELSELATAAGLAIDEARRLAGRLGAATPAAEQTAPWLIRENAETERYRLGPEAPLDPASDVLEAALVDAGLFPDIPEEAEATTARLAEFLHSRHGWTQLQELLLPSLGVDPALGAPLAPLLAQQTDLAFRTAVDGWLSGGDPPPPELIGWAGELQRHAFLLTRIGLTPAGIARIAAQPELFAAALPLSYSRAALRNLATLARYSRRGAPAEAAVAAFLEAWGANGLAGIEASVLEALIGHDPGGMLSLIDALALPDLPLEVLDAAARAADLLRKTGLDAQSLPMIAATDYDALRALAGSLRTALEARHAGSDWNDLAAAIDDEIHTLRRDGLVDWMLSREAVFGFRTPAQLYNYFLLDVEADGCNRTSRVLEAILACQLYIRRCLMSLEQSEDGEIAVTISEAARRQVEWRLTYRTFEAARKVYFHPESYLHPDLRDNRSHLFVAAQNALAQSDLSRESIEDIVRTYLSGFGDLARVTTVAAYYDWPSATYTFVGRSPQAPSVTYTRELRNLAAWTPWKPLGIDVSTPKVTLTKHRGRLHMVWTNARTPENQDWLVETQGIADTPSVQDLDADPPMRIRGTPVLAEYSFRKASGRWEKPQVVPFYIFPSKEEGVNISTIRTSDKVYADGNYPNSIGKIRLSHPIYWHGEGGYHQVFGFLDQFSNRITSREGLDVALSTGGPDPQPIVAARYQTSGLKLWTRLEQKEAGVWTAGDELGLIIQTHNAYWNSEAAAERALRLSAQEHLVQVVAQLPLRAKVDHTIVHNLCSNSIFALYDQQFLIRKTGYAGYEQDIDSLLEALAAFQKSRRKMIPLTTSVADDLGEILFEQGLEAFFSPETQKIREKTIHELGVQFDWIGELAPPVYGGNILAHPSHLEFDGSYGVYFWEIFCHLPLMIAAQLNARGKHEDADWWLRRVWDPFFHDPGASPDPAGKWRFLPFRHMDQPRLIEILQDEAALEVYREDPFNPFAIARHRPSAFRKAVVMQYLNNLLDWADDRFRDDTQESLTEARMLYVTAQQILGERPAKTGDCENLQDVVTYGQIELFGVEDSEFLVELETFIAYMYVLPHVFEPKTEEPEVRAPGLGLAEPIALPASAGSGLAALASLAETAMRPFAEIAAADVRLRTAPAALSPRAAFATAVREPDPGGEDPHPAISMVDFVALDLPFEPDPDSVPYAGVFDYAAADPGVAPEPATRFAFCVPPDPNLLELWARVEDRLFKLRHCMNIDGVRRDLPLFEPPIDPALLIRARASGLDAEGIADLLHDDVPVHRFEVLLQTARTFAATVEALGAKLLQALERKDALALEELQARFEREIVDATERVQRESRKEAEAARLGIEAAITAAQARERHYERLLTGAADPNLGINSNEILYLFQMAIAASAGVEAAEYDRKSTQTQSNLSWNATISMGGGINFGPPGGVANVVATVGFGSANMAAGEASAAAGKRKEAVAADAASAAASARATFERRKHDWEHLKDQATEESRQLERQRDAAALREIIVEREMELTAERGRQAGELLDFYRDRFTDAGLQTYLAAELGRLHRAAYARAREMALEAQRAYRFETGDDTFFIAGDTWDPNRAGLLSGEALTLKLHEMEASYLARVRRRQEVTLACPLAQIDPAALLELRTMGAAAFRIPETWFDMVYPGQYRRRIRSVRVTVPCVAGPFSPVAAKLSLTGSRMRMTPSAAPEASHFIARPRNQSIATSSGKADAGVFVFNYEGARTLPFEGAGAADSDWRIELPRELRVFDYSTITDVILTISYDAEEDGAYRETVEAGLRDRLISEAQDVPMTRVFSLRREFPDLLHRLTTAPEDDARAVTLHLGREHFPYWMREETLAFSTLRLYAEPEPGAADTAPEASVEIGGLSGTPWMLDVATGLFISDADVSGSVLDDEEVAFQLSADRSLTVRDFLVGVTFSLA